MSVFHEFTLMTIEHPRNTLFFLVVPSFLSPGCIKDGGSTMPKSNCKPQIFLHDFKNMSKWNGIKMRKELSCALNV